jgi:molybdopterin synthase catalytic subunit
MLAILLEARELPPAVQTSNFCCSSHSHQHKAAPSTIELTSMTIHHLLGVSPPLTPSLVICVSSPHRKEAFVACEWLLERVKERVQVWKREWYADGTDFVGRDGEGVEGKGNRAPEGKWKENFPVEDIAKE